MSTKYYVVLKGKYIGLFVRWEDCLMAIEGHKDPFYRVFSDPLEATLYLTANIDKENPLKSEQICFDNLLRNAELEETEKLIDSSKKILHAYICSFYNEALNTFNSSVSIVCENVIEDYIFCKGGKEFNVEDAMYYGELVGITEASKYAINKNYASLTIHYTNHKTSNIIKHPKDCVDEREEFFLGFLESIKEVLPVSFTPYDKNKNIDYMLLKKAYEQGLKNNG